MFRKKAPLELRFVIELERVDYFRSGDTIKGIAEIENSAPLELLSVDVVLIGYECIYTTKKNQVSVKKTELYRSPASRILGEHEGAVLRLSEGRHRLPFTLATQADTWGPSCHLKDRMQMLWEVTGVMKLSKKMTMPLETEKMVRLHTGRNVALQHAPSCEVQSVQRFVTHPSIEYKLTVHKPTFISGESIALKVNMNNQSRMDLVAAHFHLEQRWKYKRDTEVISLLRFELNDAPLFPLHSKESREKVIQFRLPDRLEPSVIEQYGEKGNVPITVQYVICAEFHTSKNDTHMIEVPILIEDNYPPRGAVVPPPPEELRRQPEAPPPALAAVPMAHGSYQPVEPHTVEPTPPPSESSIPEAAPYYTMKQPQSPYNSPAISLQPGALYPTVEGMPAFTPPPVPEFVDPAYATASAAYATASAPTEDFVPPTSQSGAYGYPPGSQHYASTRDPYAAENPFSTGVMLHTNLSSQQRPPAYNPNADAA